MREGRTSGVKGLGGTLCMNEQFFPECFTKTKMGRKDHYFYIDEHRFRDS